MGNSHCTMFNILHIWFACKLLKIWSIIQRSKYVRYEWDRDHIHLFASVKLSSIILVLDWWCGSYTEKTWGQSIPSQQRATLTLYVQKQAQYFSSTSMLLFHLYGHYALLSRIGTSSTERCSEIIIRQLKAIAIEALICSTLNILINSALSHSLPSTVIKDHTGLMETVALRQCRVISVKAFSFHCLLCFVNP